MKIVGIFVCMLLIGTVLSVSGNVDVERTTIRLSSGNTLYVGGSGPGNYTSIQGAIDDAEDGDTVFVYDDSSPYYENVVVNKSINLIGGDRETTVIDGNRIGDVVYVNTDGVTISGFTIMKGKDADLQAGVNIKANYTTISDNIIKDNNDGIAIWHNYEFPMHKYYLVGNIISNNIVSSNTAVGIWLSTCNLSTVTNNIILNNDFSGIHTNYANNNLISGNELSNNDYGISLYQDSDSNKIIGNNITNNKGCGIFLLESNNNNISQNNFIENGWRNAKFVYDIGALRNRWDGNYWDYMHTMILLKRPYPYPIFGRISIGYGLGVIPWLNFDWHPANEPYDILN